MADRHGTRAPDPPVAPPDRGPEKPSGGALQGARERAPAPLEHDGPLGTETVLSLFGSTARAGVWVPSDRTRALAGFGNIKLDLRRAELPGGLTEFVAIALFGNVELIVPQTLDVELDGFAIFGNLDHRLARLAKARELLGGLVGSGEERLPNRAQAEDAYVSIRGFAVFGNVTVTVV
jgi:hypothetical protein